METITLNNGVDMPALGLGVFQTPPRRTVAREDRPPLVRPGGRLDQHVLQAVSNVILEVSACRNNVSDQAEAIASKLADRVQSG